MLTKALLRNALARRRVMHQYDLEAGREHKACLGQHQCPAVICGAFGWVGMLESWTRRIESGLRPWPKTPSDIVEAFHWQAPKPKIDTAPPLAIDPARTKVRVPPKASHTGCAF